MPGKTSVRSKFMSASGSSDWDTTTYDRLSGPQQEWGAAVLNRLSVAGAETALDVGCGTGRLTEALLERLPRGRVVALDRSMNMLQVAIANLRPRFAGRVAFVRGDGTSLPFREAADIIFSTATFHWNIRTSSSACACARTSSACRPPIATCFSARSPSSPRPTIRRLRWTIGGSTSPGRNPARHEHGRILRAFVSSWPRTWAVDAV